MRVLIVSHSCVASINQQLYADVQRKTGWEISLVVPANWRDEYGRECAVERWPSFTGRLLPIPVSRPGNIILHTYRTQFAQVIREQSPDLIYVNHEPYALATAQVYWGNKRSGRRCPIGFYSCQNIYKKYPPPFRWLEAWVLRGSEFSFPISSTVDDVFRKKGYIGPSTILPLAVDVGMYCPHRNDANVRRQLNSGAGDNVLLGYVGRFVAEKGLITLFEALCEIKDMPWSLALVGAGPMESMLRKFLTDNNIMDRVTFTGFVSHAEVPPLLSAMDVLVLPSETQFNWREQFGRVLLEAMACGTPVVGSDSGEIPNLISATGGGLIFRERDSTHLATQLKVMISDVPQRSRLAAAGRDAVMKAYTMSAAAERFADSLAAVASITRPPRLSSLKEVENSNT